MYMLYKEESLPNIETVQDLTLTWIHITLRLALCTGQQGCNRSLLDVANWKGNAVLWQHRQPAAQTACNIRNYYLIQALQCCAAV